jgi:cobalt-zinc-cadmium efflux system outer membrane protein
MGLLFVVGCLSPVQREVDDLVCKSASQVMDVPPPGLLVPQKELPPRPPFDPKTQKFLERWEVPPGVPGSDAPKIIPPKGFEKKDFPEAEKQAFVDRYFKSQLEVGPDPRPVPGPDGHPLSLADLQRLAREHSPLLRQAAADIKAAEGAVIAAGVMPNPTIGYNTTPVSLTSGQTIGPSVTQTLPTMGKKFLQESAANKDLDNARLAYRRAETDLMTNIRSNYFAVLVAQEGMRANRGLMELTDEIFTVMKLQFKGGQVAAYEPGQIGVFAGQARIAYIQSRNSYLASWKLLATSIGLTMMPVTELSGSVTRELPRFDFDKSLAHVLKNHTDALTALNGLEKARFNQRLAEVTAVPDVTLGISVLHDNSLPGPPRYVPAFIGSITLPIWDRNQGNIRSAQAQLLRAAEQPHATQNNLTASFVDAYRRLEESRQILYLYRMQLLPQQVQAFRATVLRHNAIGPVEVGLPGGSTAYFSDLITSEQNLVSLIATYLTTLGSYWQAVSDTASLLQIDDVYATASAVDHFPDADPIELLKLPCCHPCSSLQHAGSHDADCRNCIRTPEAMVQPVAQVSSTTRDDRGMRVESPKTTAIKTLPATLPTRPVVFDMQEANREQATEGEGGSSILVPGSIPAIGNSETLKGGTR